MVRIKVFPKSKNTALGGGGGYSNSSAGLKSTKGVYLWGQYHDHTQDIDGDLESKGKITTNELSANTVSAVSATIESFSGISATVESMSATSATVNTLSGKNATIDALTADTISSTTINNAGLINTNQIKAVSGYIQTLLGENWTVDNLTVTKAAHFFKLIIDEIKATQGAIIITPANCVIDHVETLSNGNYRCYFLNKDDENEINNNFEVNDQVICQTFNVATGTSYDVSNTFYWRLCVGTGTTGDYHYIDLSNTDKDQYSNAAPQAGDNCVLLGNRTDTTRQAAIIISAYNSGYLDKGIVAPSICQYEGINDYDLTRHRMNVLSKGLNSFKGTFITSTGEDMEDLLDKQLSGVTTYLHVAYAMSENGSSGFSKTYFEGATYIGMCSNRNEDDSSLIYSDYVWARFKGENGENGANGEKGDSITIVSHTVKYASSNDASQPSETSFSTTMPELSEGAFIWTLTTVTYSDGTVIKSYSVSRIGSDGAEGTPGTNGKDGLTTYLHIAYANSADGSQNFSVTYFNDAKYIGTYIDDRKADSTDYRDYEWKVLRGNDGKDITITKTEILYAQTQTQSQPSESSFSSTMPDAIAGYYMWTLTRITYSDGTVTRAYSCTKNGNNGQSGATGADGEMYKLVPIRELAIVDKNGTLGVNLQYNIVHIKGNTAEEITSSSSGYYIKFNPNHTSTYYSLSTGTTYPSYESTNFMSNYHTTGYRPTYLSVRLYNRGGSPVDIRTVTVTFDAGATLEVTDKITATVTANKQETDGKISANTTHIAALSATAESITSKVEANTTNINSVSGTVESTKKDVSSLQQTASGLTSTVESHTTQIGGLKGQVQYLDSEVSSLNQTASGLTSTVQRIDNTISAHSESISEIRQTADDITLSVNDLSIKLDNTKFEINADTVVNGSLTLTNDNQGFILKGSSGTTEISPKSVGKWANWSEKTTIPVETNVSKPLEMTKSGIMLYAFGEINTDLGYVASSKYISVSNPCAYTVDKDGNVVTPQDITLFRIRLYREGSTTPVTTFTASTTCHAGTVINYYTSYSDNYRVKVEYQVRFKSTQLASNVGTLIYTGIVNLPTDGYSILGYDGLGMSFGGSSYFFSNYEGTWMKYGNYGLAVRNSGIFIYNSSKGVWSLWDGSSGESGANVGCKYISVNGNNYSVDANGFINLPNYPQKVVSAVTLNGTTYAASNSASTVSLPNLVKSAVVNGYTINATSAGVLGLGTLARTITFNGKSYTPTTEGTIMLPLTVTGMTVNGISCSAGANGDMYFPNVVDEIKVNGSKYSPNEYGTLTFPTVVTSITNGSATVTPNAEGTLDILSILSDNFLRTDIKDEQTIKGDLWLKKDGNYGNKIIFGNKFFLEPRVYIGEPEDDKLTLYGMSGVTMSGATDKIYASQTVEISGTSGVNVTTDSGKSVNLNNSFKAYPDKFSTSAYAYTHYDNAHMYLRMTNGTYTVSTAFDTNGGIGLVNRNTYTIYSDRWNTLYVKPTKEDIEKTSQVYYDAYFRGNGYITGTWTQASDERFKDKIEDKEYSIEDFANAPLFSFTWTPEPEPLELEDDDSEVKACTNTVDTDEHVGTTAQYWKNRIPELVKGSDEDRYGIDYSTLGTVGAITNAREIVKLKQENEELKARLTALEELVGKLTANA